MIMEFVFLIVWSVISHFATIWHLKQDGVFFMSEDEAIRHEENSDPNSKKYYLLYEPVASQRENRSYYTIYKESAKEALTARYSKFSGDVRGAIAVFDGSSGKVPWIPELITFYAPRMVIGGTIRACPKCKSNKSVRQPGVVLNMVGAKPLDTSKFFLRPRKTRIIGASWLDDNDWDEPDYKCLRCDLEFLTHEKDRLKRFFASGGGWAAIQELEKERGEGPKPQPHRHLQNQN